METLLKAVVLEVYGGLGEIVGEGGRPGRRAATGRATCQGRKVMGRLIVQAFENREIQDIQDINPPYSQE